MNRLVIGLLFCFFVARNLVFGLSPSLNDDILGLIVFKADVNDPLGNLVSWNEDDDTPCNWRGLKCNPRSNRVSELVLDGFSLSGKLGRGLLQLQFLNTLSLANNNLTGSLTLSLAQLSVLRVLDLSKNSLSGPISLEFFQQCGSLKSLSLANNQLSGSIPEGLSSCSALTYLNVSSNQFSGQLPSWVWSLNGLRSIDLSDNLLDGEIPKGIEGLSNLRVVSLRKNKLIGSVPDGIGACLLLRSIDLGENSLSGPLPTAMQKLGLCNVLNLQKNGLSGEIPDWIGEMRSLETLDLSGNNLTGSLPPSLGQLQSLKLLNLSANSFTGILPESMAKCVNLLVLDLSRNALTGEVPSWVFRLGLQQLILTQNRLNGTMDNALSFSLENSLQRLLLFDASHNIISGQIPLSIGAFSTLQYLSMSNNSLSGAIPSSIGQLKSLNILDLSSNQLNGSIPSEIGGATSLKEVLIENNFLEGSIPTSIEKCSLLSFISLSMNDLTGSVPISLSKLAKLHYVDLSFNKLSGSLPKQLANLGGLVYFNVSHNQLEGELPGGAFFNTISPSSVSENPGLCGAPVNKTCPTVLPKPIVLNPNSTDSNPGLITQKLGHEKKILSISALIAIGAAATIFVGVIAVIVLNLRVPSLSSPSAVALTFSGGDDEFSQSPSMKGGDSGKLVMFTGDDPDFSVGAHALLNKDCELGRGGFGAVYRTVLKDGHSIAIKKLTVSSVVKSQEEFEREVKKLAKAHHQNLVTLQGYYWTSSLQLLIYEFVSGGNLYKQLHDEGRRYLSWNERFSIILGTSRSISYLHQMNIIHYNLKSSNILLDESREPKVADYGLARLLPMLDRYVLSSKVQSALGYMAPEFACKTVKITEKCDVYGFGILVLEIVTGKRPVEYMEDDVVVLSDMVRGAIEEGRVEECVDCRLQGKFPADEAIPVMKLGLICTSQVPSNRPTMAEVVNILELLRCPSGTHDDELLPSV